MDPIVSSTLHIVQDALCFLLVQLTWLLHVSSRSTHNIGISSLECVRYRRILMSCLKRVLSTNGVEPPSSSLMLDRKEEGVSLQYSMWNILRKYDEYLDCEIMILELF